MKQLKNVYQHFLIRKRVSKALIKYTTVLVFALLLTSCSSIRVAADYDREVNFNNYKTFAFFKPGIDKAEISDLDKRRILRAIEAELMAKGLTKSENPDMLVSIFTKSNQRVDVFNNAWGMSGWGWGGNQVSTRTEGMLFIDFIDTRKKDLIWQGSGTGYLITKNVEKKEARIKAFVAKTMEQFPPKKE